MGKKRQTTQAERKKERKKRKKQKKREKTIRLALTPFFFSFFFFFFSPILLPHETQLNSTHLSSATSFHPSTSMAASTEAHSLEPFSSPETAFPKR